MIVPKFVWRCPNDGELNESTQCSHCKYDIDLSEAHCIHGFAYDMACDDCVRSGFRFEGVNDGTEAERTGCDGSEMDEVIKGLPPDNQPYLPLDLIEDQLADEGSMDGPGFRCERLKKASDAVGTFNICEGGENCHAEGKYLVKIKGQAGSHGEGRVLICSDCFGAASANGIVQDTLSFKGTKPEALGEQFAKQQNKPAPGPAPKPAPRVLRPAGRRKFGLGED